MYNPYSLEDKTILVTGASSGIGKATAIECSKLGATLVITARNEQRLKETLDALEGEGHQMFITDVSETKQIEELVNKLPVVNGVACNAGIVNTTLVNFYQDEIIEKLFKTNTFSMMMLTKFLVKKKKLAKGGSIVYTSSIGNVFNADIANGIYGATKCAIDGFMRTAALELAAKGIRCNTVNPGMINTPAINGLGAITSEQLEKDAQRYPLKRFGKPEEIAYGIIYLLSDASSFVTGTALKIDGGITL
jgi:NAD(P)-dependent dehydrogenase (short-subunit alcohol dehydrogenase family)